MSYLKPIKTIIILTAFFSFFCRQVIAQTNQKENVLKSGKNYAMKICQSYSNNQLKNDCKNIVTKADFLDINAVNLCEYKFALSAKTLTCLANISGTIYTDQELQKCLNINNEYEIYQCLSQGGNLIKSENSNKEKPPQSPTNNESNNEESDKKSICDSLTDSVSKRKCEQIIANSYFLDLSAINLCQNKISATNKILDCLESINNKIYSSIEINQCNQIKKENELIICLSNNGELVNK